MDVSAVVLNKLLIEQNLEVWGKLKLAFLDPAYSTVYSAISRHYDKYSVIPTFDDLEITGREGLTQKTLATLRLIDETEISAEVALDALIDQYTQNEAIRLLDKFIDNLPLYDSTEVKENLSDIVLKLDEKTLTTEGVYSMSDLLLFVRPDEHLKSRVFMGLNNTFDSVLGGMARQELVLIGGGRGSGKSVVCSNLQINQYEAGFTSVYFTIEMIAKETLTRNMSILANVNHLELKNNKLNDVDMLKVVQARADMYIDAQHKVEEYLRTRDVYRFEETLTRECKLKDHQMIIIDNRALTLSALDLHLGKLKARFGDNFTTAVVDYLNQMVPAGNNAGGKYDWQPQIVIASGLKELARKHDILIVSPYQIDGTGEARFAKGILDAPDVAAVLNAHKKEDSAISFDTTKIRGGPPMAFTSPINWDTLRISPTSIEKPTAKEKEKPSKQMQQTEEKASDAPW